MKRVEIAELALFQKQDLRCMRLSLQRSGPVRRATVSRFNWRVLFLPGRLWILLREMGGRAFVLSLSGIWERGLRKMCDLATVQTGWNRRPDSDRIRRWDDPVGRDDRGRRVAARWAWL
jgi:hypothetical protein